MQYNYNKNLVYLDTRINSTEMLGKKMIVGGMKVEDRVLVYMITHILTPRANNHAQVTDDDVQLLYCVKKGLKVTWISIISEVMKKVVSSSESEQEEESISEVDSAENRISEPLEKRIILSTLLYV